MLINGFDWHLRYAPEPRRRQILLPPFMVYEASNDKRLVTYTNVETARRFIIQKHIAWNKIEPHPLPIESYDRNSKVVAVWMKGPGPLFVIASKHDDGNAHEHAPICGEGRIKPPM